MIDKSFLEKIEQLFRPRVITINEEIYATVPFSLVEPPHHLAETLVVRTLGSVCDYISANSDDLDLNKHTLHVASPTRVRLVSNLDDHRKREIVLSGTFESPTDFEFGRYYSAEDFNVFLQTHFFDANDRAKVLKVVGNITHEDVRSTEDDGVTQTVQARAGIARSEDAHVPNPVTLRPWRTFPEIDQPSSMFVLRMQEGPRIALFEADGGKWELEAINSIHDCLAKWLKDAVAIVA